MKQPHFWLFSVLGDTTDNNDPDESSGYLAPDYSTTRVTAMMAHDEIILLDDTLPKTSLIAAPSDDDIDRLNELADSAEVTELSTDTPEKFSIRLLFPDKQAPTLIFPVRARMPVALLRLQISELVESPHLVHLLLGPSWDYDILEHKGSITDRVFPNTNIPCPYLQQGTRVLVYLTRPDPDYPPSPVPIGSSSLDVAPAVGGWRPIESFRETNTALSSTSVVPYESLRNLRAMEGSGKTPYEPPSNPGTMEGSSCVAEAQTTTTPYEPNRYLEAMEGSDKTPYEPSRSLGTMECQKSTLVYLNLSFQLTVLR
jgi:hypothetical protein